MAYLVRKNTQGKYTIFKKSDSEFKQDTGYNCGPAALSFVMTKQGKPVSQEELEKRTETTKEGVDDKDMIRVAHEYGFPTIILENHDGQETIDELDSYAKKGMYGLLGYVFGEGKDDEHYAVFIEKKDPNTITIYNSWYGKYEDRSIDSFIQKWTGAATDDHPHKYRNWAVVLAKTF